MIDRDYIVKFITSKNSFIFLSDKDLRRFDQDLLIRISYGVCKTAYFTLGPPLNSLKEGELALCSVLAKELGIIKGDTVSLSSSPNYSSIRKLNIIPSSKDDYEILGLLAEDIQNTLLHQVRVVHNKQKLVIWISNSLRVIVDVEGILPISPGKLEQMTEISILEPNAHNSNDRNKPEVKKRNSIALKDNPLNKYNKTQIICRLHPVEDLKDLINKDLDNNYLEQPFNIFISRKKLPIDLQENVDIKTVILVKFKIIRYESENTEIANDVIARLFIVEDICDSKLVNTSIVFANKCIFDHLNANVGAKVIIELLKEFPKPVKSIEIMTKSSYFSKADELVRNYLIHNCQQGQFLINRDVILMEPNGCKFLLKFDADTLYCLIDRSFMRSCKFSLHDTELVLDKDKDEKKEPPLNLYLECSNYNKIVEDTIRCLQMKLDNEMTDSSNVLWVGKLGTGKTALASHLSKTISQAPHRVHVELLTCKKLKGKNIDSLQKILNGTLVKLIYFQPSLLILDDLHVICEKVIEGEAPTQENLHFNKVSEMLLDVLVNCIHLNNICILATAESTNKLNQNVFSSRGNYLFKNVFNIDDLNQNDRTGVMKHLFKMKDVECSSIDYDNLSLKTEGFVIQDLIDYSDKIIFEAYKDHICDDNFKLSNKHCEEALKNTSSLSLRDVKLHSPGERDFSDVGGLEDIKKMLIECMLWPAQYPNIFGKAPLRLQSGVLLYGPPGTGKTILAGAAAKQCNLRLISIKGPELLSKYIGASEQAVRDVFQKAQSAKPCILFFDEFDSLAPRRGHDNTGVTDRVVNQFLTQLDGVESLTGVCVLAATSRPDLLDPALLRPGRLDRQILCPMPDRNSRLAILKVLSKALVLTKDVNLEKVADDTVGYSGADLQAVLYTAQLSSVEHLLETNTDATNKETLVTQAFLEDAIRTTRPSLTRDEKLRYERIYSKFQGTGDILDIQSGKQKATLA